MHVLAPHPLRQLGQPLAGQLGEQATLLELVRGRRALARAHSSGGTAGGASGSSWPCPPIDSCSSWSSCACSCSSGVGVGGSSTPLFWRTWASSRGGSTV